MNHKEAGQWATLTAISSSDFDASKFIKVVDRVGICRIFSGIFFLDYRSINTRNPIPLPCHVTIISQ